MGLNKHSVDIKLVEELRKGDIEAFDQVFRKYGGRLYGFTFRYLKSKEETEGLVQDVFLKVWENRKNLKKESSLKSYLFTIAYHQICHFFRKKKIHEKFLEDRSATTDFSFNPEEQMEYKAILEQVNELIDQMPKTQKIIFIKSRKEGKSSKQIAAEMNLAPGTVDNQISAALKFLREHIKGSDIALLLYLSVFF